MKVYINRIKAGKIKKRNPIKDGADLFPRLKGVNVDLSRSKAGDIEADVQGVYANLASVKLEAGQMLMDISFWRTDWFLSIILMRVRPYFFAYITRDSLLEVIDDEG